jgi:hypothetical protein
VRKVVAAGIGTLCTVFGGKYSASANASPMQTLAWLAKNNREPDKRKKGNVNHPRHPSGEPRLLATPADAYVYAAELITSPGVNRALLKALGIAGFPIALVPIPASETTKRRSSDERWPARDLAEELQSRGMGTVRLCVVNKTAREMQTSSKVRLPAHDVAANLDVIARPARGEAVLFVEDVITWGVSVATIDHVLGWKGPTAAICVAFSDKGTADCYLPRKRIVEYGATSTPWGVRIYDPERTT